MLEQTGWAALIAKVGFVKLLSLGAALLGAGIMAAFRPPEGRIGVFKQGAVALGTAFLFGGVVVDYLDSWFTWIDLATASVQQIVQFNIAVHGLLGAFAWGLWGGAAVLRDRVAKDPTKAFKEIKDDLTS